MISAALPLLPTAHCSNQPLYHVSLHSEGTRPQLLGHSLLRGFCSFSERLHVLCQALFFARTCTSYACAHWRYGTDAVQVACWQPTAGPKRDVPTLDVCGLKIAVRVTLLRFTASLWKAVRERSL